MRAVSAPTYAPSASTSMSTTRAHRALAARAYVAPSRRVLTLASSRLQRASSSLSRVHRTRSPHAFLWWSQEKELRKRWKQFMDFAADEVPQERFGGKKGNAAKLMRWIGEYPLTAAGVATAFAGGISAAVSAAVLPVVAGVMFLALPGLIFAFIGTAAFMFIAGATVLVLALPALGFLSVAGGSIGAVLSAKLLPLTIIAAGVVFATKALEFGVNADARAGALSGADSSEDDWAPTNVNRADDADASADDEEDFEETVKRNFDERLRALDRKK